METTTDVVTGFEQRKQMTQHFIRDCDGQKFHMPKNCSMAIAISSAVDRKFTKTVRHHPIKIVKGKS